MSSSQSVAELIASLTKFSDKKLPKKVERSIESLKLKLDATINAKEDDFTGDFAVVSHTKREAKEYRNATVKKRKIWTMKKGRHQVFKLKYKNDGNTFIKLQVCFDAFGVEFWQDFIMFNDSRAPKGLSFKRAIERLNRYNSGKETKPDFAVWFERWGLESEIIVNFLYDFERICIEDGVPLKVGELFRLLLGIESD